MNPRTNDDASSDAAVVLLRRWHDGEATALDQLLDLVLPAMRRYASSRLGPNLRRRLDTNDAVQDAVAGFLRDGPRFSVMHDGQLHQLLHRIVDNVILGHHRYWGRKRRALARERPLSNLSSVILDEDARSAGTETDRESMVRLALELLDPLEQRVVCMRVYDQRSHDEIANELGTSVAAIRQRFSRGMRRLEEKVRQLEQRNPREFLMS